MNIVRNAARALAVAAAVATVGLSATTAFASTTGHDPNPQPTQSWGGNNQGGNNNQGGDKGGKGNQDPNGNKGWQDPKGNGGNNWGDPKGCTQDNWLTGKNGGDFRRTLEPWGSQCKPAPKPPVCNDTWGWQTSFTGNTRTGDLRRHVTWGQNNNCDPRPVDPRPVVCENNWSWQTSWSQGRDGRDTRFETWGENWGQQNCDHHQRPPVRCNTCKTASIVFQFSTYGDWLKELYGPALYDGEHLTYLGQTYTVEDYTTHGNGSQGFGTYFVLQHNSVSLQSPGTRWNPAQDVNAVAHTICQHQHFGDQGNFWLTA